MRIDTFICIRYVYQTYSWDHVCKSMRLAPLQWNECIGDFRKDKSYHGRLAFFQTTQKWFGNVVFGGQLQYKQIKIQNSTRVMSIKEQTLLNCGNHFSTRLVRIVIKCWSLSKSSFSMPMTSMCQTLWMADTKCGSCGRPVSTWLGSTNLNIIVLKKHEFRP